MIVLVPVLAALVALVGNAKAAVFAAVAVPVAYAVATKWLDFYVRWELKGRRSRGEYRIWVEDEGQEWELRTGDVEKMVALHGKGSKVAHVEQSVRFRNGNPYSLGLDLTAGAFAVDVASLIGGEGSAGYLGWAMWGHGLMLIGMFALVLANQQAHPNEVGRMRTTAALAVAVGLAAMATSFLGLDAELVEQILNLGGNR